ncbi:MAG: FtsW/RodA/SpoVE family cell cycle protein, partial [Candidatus Cryptobacteroides sp.]
KKKMKKIQQPYSAKIAIHEGGLFKKGVGGSTQKYVVPVMYGDFIYCYILEETGLFGGVVIILLYLSLIARGVLITRNCPDIFARTSVAGLIILITSQAFMHIAINLDMGPLTGQTLPIISHGASAFLCFCLAFGVILSMSKMSWEATSQEERQADIERGRLNETTEENEE